METLFMYTGSALAAQKLKDEGVDYVAIITEKDPGCNYVFHNLKTVATTVIGPGSTTITKEHARQAIKTWAYVGSFSLTISADYEQSMMDTVSKSVSRTYSAPAGKPCTPSMLSASALCHATKAHVYLGKGGKLFKEDIIELADLFLPITTNHKDFFTNIFGCIDYSLNPF
ncbi:hypothetical protein L0F63_003382 [Massospora cicadina]|nr:hypothetical protein L0F63_003382 [Massospora cicadina]